MSDYQIWQGLTWLHDSSVAMVRMVFAGVFEKHPDLKMIIHHHGSLIPLFKQRMQYAWDFFEQNTKRDFSKTISKPYIDHFKNFYCDTATQGYDPDILENAMDFFGPEKLLFGTDCPMDASSGDYFIQDARKSLEDIGMSKENITKIYSGNIANLIGLDIKSG